MCFDPHKLLKTKVNLKAGHFSVYHGNISFVGEDDTDITKFGIIGSTGMDYLLLSRRCCTSQTNMSQDVRNIMIDYILKDVDVQFEWTLPSQDIDSEEDFLIRLHPSELQ